MLGQTQDLAVGVADWLAGFEQARIGGTVRNIWRCSSRRSGKGCRRRPDRAE
jgi:hypothetical protein